MKAKKMKSLLAITGLLLTFNAQAQYGQAQEGIDAQTTVERCGFVIADGYAPTMGLRVSGVILLTDSSYLLPVIKRAKREEKNQKSV